MHTKKRNKVKIQYSSMKRNQGENIRTQLFNVLFVKIPCISYKYYGLENIFDCICVEIKLNVLLFSIVLYYVAKINLTQETSRFYKKTINNSEINPPAQHLIIQVLLISQSYYHWIYVLWRTNTNLQ